jgi:hypothetical protein
MQDTEPEIWNGVELGAVDCGADGARDEDGACDEDGARGTR